MAALQAAFLLFFALAADGDRMRTILQTGTQVHTQPIAKGQTLTIPLSGWQIGGIIKINSGADGDVGLQMELKQDGDAKYIARSSVVGGSVSLEDSWGGWPLGPLSRAATFALTLTDTKWEVVLDGERTPWFDYPVPSAQQAALDFPSFELTNLVTSTTPSVANRVCSLTCSADECLCGGASCSIKLSSGFCTTSGLEGECCTGFQDTYTIETAIAGSVASLVPDEAFLDRACASADIDGFCTDIKNQLTYTGAAKNVQVLSRELSTVGDFTGRVLTFFPESHAKLMVSPWMLIPATPVDGSVVLTGDPGLTIDSGTAQVVNINYVVHPLPTAGGTTFLAFATRLEQNGQLYQFTMDRLTAFANSGSSYTLTYSDSPRLAVEDDCVDIANWRDAQTNSADCTRYGGSDALPAWCTKFGLTTTDWTSHVGGAFSFAAFAVSGVSAADACCACGGGTPVAR